MTQGGRQRAVAHEHNGIHCFWFECNQYNDNNIEREQTVKTFSFFFFLAVIMVVGSVILALFKR